MILLKEKFIDIKFNILFLPFTVWMFDCCRKFHCSKYLPKGFLKLFDSLLEIKFFTNIKSYEGFASSFCCHKPLKFDRLRYQRQFN